MNCWIVLFKLELEEHDGVSQATASCEAVMVAPDEENVRASIEAAFRKHMAESSDLQLALRETPARVHSVDPFDDVLATSKVDDRLFRMRYWAERTGTPQFGPIVWDVDEFFSPDLMSIMATGVQKAQFADSTATRAIAGADAMDRELEWLQRWQLSQADGDWEHEYGVRIRTLSNPGWTIEIDLTGTELHDRAFEEFSWRQSDQEWIYCRVEENVFHGACGPRGLVDGLRIFREWATE